MAKKLGKRINIWMNGSIVVLINTQVVYDEDLISDFRSDFPLIADISTITLLLSVSNIAYKLPESS